MFLEKEGKKLGIDLIEEEKSFEATHFFEKYLLLQRSGLNFTYISVLEWHFRKEEVLGNITQR